MSLRQAWNQSTIVNKIGAITGIIGAMTGLAGLLVSLINAGISRKQLGEVIRTNHEQRLLNWERLRQEDDGEMPDILPVTVPDAAASANGQIAIQLVNFGSGGIKYFLIDYPPSPGAVISMQAPIPSHGAPLTVTVPANKIDRKKLARIVYLSPHGSACVKTFYFTSDNQSTVVDSKIDRNFDFLIKDEPGRKNYKPYTAFGFGPPNGEKP